MCSFLKIACLIWEKFNAVVNCERYNLVYRKKFTACAMVWFIIEFPNIKKLFQSIRYDLYSNRLNLKIVISLWLKNVADLASRSQNQLGNVMRNTQYCQFYEFWQIGLQIQSVDWRNCKLCIIALQDDEICHRARI